MAVEISAHQVSSAVTVSHQTAASTSKTTEITNNLNEKVQQLTTLVSQFII